MNERATRETKADDPAEEAGGFAVSPSRPGDEHGILALFNEVFAVGNPDFVPRPLSHWRWAFADNPEGHQTFVAEARGAEEGRIVGTYTAMPARWRFPEGIHWGAQAVDTVVAPRFRRSLRKNGLFLTLADRWFAHYGCPERDRIVYGFPNPQAFRIGTTKVGYLPVHCPMPELSLPVAAAARLAAPGVSPGIHVEEIEQFGREVDAFDAALAPRLGISAVRDARYLNWRYTQCPTTRYRLLRAESATGALRGFLVFSLGWHGFRKEIAPIVDFLVAPGDLATWRALLGAAARAAARFSERTLETLLAWAPPPHRHAEDLRSLGFTAAPSRFNLCIRIFTESFDLDHAKQHWYVVMGDSDMY
jgi:hypothetical protein